MFPRNSSLHFFTLILFATASGAAQASKDARPLALDDLVKRIREEVQPAKAMDYMRSVYATDRFFTFPSFQKTAQYLSDTMKSIGLEQVEIVHPPADGETQFGYWTMPLAWDARSAKLEIVSPGVAPEQRMLADYEQTPASLGMWSGPTPPEGIEADVVFVSREDLRNLEKLDLRGKIALMDVNPAGYKWLLVKANAVGAINAFTENPNLEDGRQWINAWGDNGWAFTKDSTPLLSFSITPRQFKFLRNLLKSGPVRLKATVDTRYYKGSYPYVTGVIAGTGLEEVLTLAHTSEQGAQDNATGVAAALESLATLNRLIAAGKLPKPRRSIRILLMGEMYGSMHYVASNPSRIRKTMAAFCVDTPAASYELAGTEYSFHLNPHVSKDFTDAFILKLASTYFPTVKRPWHEKRFATGTDTYLAEPMVGIPTIWSYSSSGVETHHNSADTPDRVDPRSLRDLSVVVASFLYYIANAEEPEAVWLAGLSETRGYGEILKQASAALDSIDKARDVQTLSSILADGEDRIAYAVDRERQAVMSVLRLVPDSRKTTVDALLRPMVERLKDFAETQRLRCNAAAHRRAQVFGYTGELKPMRRVRPDQAEAAKIVVKRKRFGTLPLDDLPREKWEGQPSGAWATVPTIALYWCDGKRNLAEVIHLTEMELGPTDFNFVAYFRFLEKHGYVEFVR
ncbi:MAG: M28 family peptidase [Bryobacteraceae bacterium]|nr:M28 family peptidase [Bryobacteraceae bacterium]